MHTMVIGQRLIVLTALLLVGITVPACQEDDAPPTLTTTALTAPGTDADSPTTAKPRSRTFEFDYGVTVRDVPAGSRLLVWLPVPQTTSHQQASRLRQDVPVEPQQTTESKYGNQMLHFELEPSSAKPLTFQVTWQITRNEVRGLDHSDPDARLDDAKRKTFLSANAKVPIDGKPLTLIDSSKLSRDNPIKLGRSLYERVDDHMRYDKSQPGYGNGDVLWACDSGFGNCTDFHSLFISLARGQDLPARFEIGFPLPPTRGEGTIGGYHCWAQFHVDGHGWVPTDISEADKHPELKNYYYGNLTEDRVQLTVGRDITLEPAQQGEPLNYFIYPHIEVDGKSWPVEKTDRAFAFRDR
jgi:transglutaminase-like putative cysteine protease